MPELKLVDNATCTFCGCVCDDMELTVEDNRITKAKNACVLGKAWFLNHHVEERPVATIRGQPATLDEAVEEAAQILIYARYPIVYGLSDTTCEAQRVAIAIADWIGAQGFGRIAFLMVVNIILLIVGCIMEPASVTLILAPILFPVAAKLGIDPVHFGIIMVVNMEIGMVTPPVGLNLYVASSISKLGLTEMSKAVTPWLLTMLAFLMLVTYWPELSLWLPRWAGVL